MEKVGTIFEISNLTNWCAAMVPVSKRGSSKALFCVNLQELNKGIIRNRLILTTVKESLDDQAGTKLFSKLDLSVGLVLFLSGMRMASLIEPIGRLICNVVAT